MSNPRKPINRQVAEGDPGHRGRKKLRAQGRPKSLAPFDGASAGAELSLKAREIFDFAVEELSDMRVLGRPDRMIMVAMANAYADAAEARVEASALRQKGKRTRDMLQAIARAEKREDRKLALFVKCSDRLGLSPRSRENLTIAPQDEGMEDLMELLSRPRVQRTGPIPSPADRERGLN